MRLSRIFSLLLICIMLSALPVMAQESADWFVYFFDSVNNDLVRVDASGAMQLYPLALAEGELVNISELAISNDGTLLAFCKWIFDTPDHTLVVREIASGNNVFEMPIAPGYNGCRPSSFNSTGTQLALGLAREGFGTSGQDASPLWRLQVLDVPSGAVVHELTSEMPDAPVMDEYGRGGPVPLMADVLHFQGPDLIFRGIPYIGMEISAELPAWRWNLRTRTLTPIDNIGHLYSDYLPAADELAYPGLDASLPAAQPGGPLPQANAIIVQNSDGSSQVVYRNTQEVILNVHFINDGQALGISLLKALDMANPSAISTIRHVVLDRSGNVMEVGADYEQFTQLKAVPGGAVITWSEMAGEGAPIAHLGIVEGDTLREIWSYQPPLNGGYSFLDLIWTPPVEAVSGLPNFAPVQ